MSYEELLQLPQWQRKRQQVLTRDGGRCRHCGAGDQLQVHHRQYHRHRQTGEFIPPWAYPAPLLITLCKACHRNGHATFTIPVFFI